MAGTEPRRWAEGYLPSAALCYSQPSPPLRLPSVGRSWKFSPAPPIRHCYRWRIKFYRRQLAPTQRKGGPDRLPRPGMGDTHTGEPLGACLSLAQDPLISGKNREERASSPRAGRACEAGRIDDSHARPEFQFSSHTYGIRSRGWESVCVFPAWKSRAEPGDAGSPAGRSHCLSFAKFIPQTPLELPLGTRWFPSVPRFIPDRLHTIY